MSSYLNNLENLPILPTFKDLKLNDKVYTSQFGLGEIVDFYNDEIIVLFINGFRKRFNVDDREIRSVPKENLKKTKLKQKIIYNGQKMAPSTFKKIQNEAHRVLIKECVSLNQAQDILGVSKKVLNALIKDNNISLIQNGKITMIHRNDLLHLAKQDR